MLKVGLTGGIGSGKTVVSDAFACLGVPVIDTDVIAREVLKKDKNLLMDLAKHFGLDILDEHKELIRSKLRDRAFKNENNKALLDKIMHPAIRQETQNQMQIAKDKGAPYSIIVVPLLIETGFIKLVDRILVITAPLERKFQWLEKRSQLDKEKTEKIIAMQSSDEDKLEIADDHIHNDSDILSIQKKVRQLHEMYLSL